MTSPHPTLKFVLSGDSDAVESEVCFGYLRNERVALIKQGDQTVLIPRDVLVTAVNDGWLHQNDCPHCEAESGGKDE